MFVFCFVFVFLCFLTATVVDYLKAGPLQKNNRLLFFPCPAKLQRDKHREKQTEKQKVHYIGDAQSVGFHFCHLVHVDFLILAITEYLDTEYFSMAH